MKYKNYLCEGMPLLMFELARWVDGRIHYDFYGNIVGVMINGKEIKVTEVKEKKE